MQPLALRYRSVIFLIVGLLMAFGAYSYFTLPAREDPEILIRDAVVVTPYPGLETEQVELLITKPLEEAILTLPELKEVKSTSMEGMSIIHAIIEDQYTDLDTIFDQLAETIDEAQPQLPQGTIPSVVNDDFGDVAVITLALWGDDYSLADLNDYGQHLRDQLFTIPGAKKVEVVGVQEERIFVEYENAVLSQAGITPGAIGAALQDQNIVRSGGQIDTGETAFAINPSGDLQSVADIENVLVAVPGTSTLLRLGDVATVKRGYVDPPSNKAFYNGKETVVLTIAMQSDQSVINFSRRASEKIDALRQTLPAGLNFDIITYQSDQVENAVYGATINMLQTLAIVLIVVIIFLGVRTGLIVGSIIPAVVLATLGIMGVFGMQLERMSLATLIISLGLLVDNGIVVAEDFKRRLEEHGDRDKAYGQTIKELAFPLLASSFTTIAVFLPLLIAETASTEYTRSISLVVLIALTTSWVLAMTVTTTLCYFFAKPGAAGSSDEKDADLVTKGFHALEGGYKAVLKLILRFRLAYVAFMIGLFVLGGMLMGTVQQQFFPSSDRAQLLVYVDMPAGVTARTTEARMKDLMAVAADKETYPDIQDYAAYVGFGGPRFVLSLSPVDPAPNKGFMVMNITDIEAADALVPKLRNAFRAAAPDANTRVSRMFLGPADPNVLHVQVRGPDADYIFEKSKELERMLLDIPGTFDVWTDWHNRVDRIDVKIDQQKARIAGVTSSDVSQALAQYVSGVEISEYREGDETIPIVMRGAENERTSLSQLETTAIYSRLTGQSVPLSQVATLERSPGFSFIQREDMIRTVTVEGLNLTLTPEDMAPMLAEPLAAFNDALAPGHFAELDGILDDSGATNAALAATLPLILGMILVFLVALFNGFSRPLILLLCLPFAVIGAAVGLVVMGATFGFMVILGLYALMGIIINNSIVLVDRIDIERREAEEDTVDAVISACLRRLRPILMASITTIIGLLPLIIFQDILFYGMAVAIAFGLGIGTLIISLGLTPVLYCLFFGLRYEGKAKTKQPSGEPQGASA
ncbi:efflux RND transporter permease subunit [Hyphomonas sp. KY3]|uniref:efflux RND transporter permease subunit n=1 Tax=Hyphomonas sp. KY3 TaxID=2016196 RepID=UPI001A8E8223|nr:efflux RND transporter permease subunit [Hyphomonas sp. KY3]QSR22025.1 acriflavine resistance protein B [Hyphomonas sp. KY3]